MRRRTRRSSTFLLALRQAKPDNVGPVASRLAESAGSGLFQHTDCQPTAAGSSALAGAAAAASASASITVRVAAPPDRASAPPLQRSEAKRVRSAVELLHADLRDWGIHRNRLRESRRASYFGCCRPPGHLRVSDLDISGPATMASDLLLKRHVDPGWRMSVLSTGASARGVAKIVIDPFVSPSVARTWRSR